jgi:sulfite exporter TauE/SafE
MCGGFVVGYTAKGVKEGKKPHQMHLSYALGKTASYTIIGALFGLLGSIIAFTPKIRGYAGIFAGLFLIIFGLKMLNIFPWLRKFRLTVPKFIAKFAGYESKKHANNPLVIGLLNGLMIACGPLQAIYIMAAGSGSMIEGAKMLFVFGVGTLPVLLGFGYFTSFVSTKATNKILKASATIVIILGLIMLNRGVALTGSGYDINSMLSGSSVSQDGEKFDIEMENGYQIIRMEVNKYGWSPDKFVLKKGVPAKWVITGKEITGCNRAINVPKLDLEFDISMGEQIIEFTPTEAGKIPFSCWMGMIPGVFVVVDDGEDVGNALTGAVVAKGSSCGGGCGCGG